MPSCSTDVSLRHTSTIPRVFHSAHAAVAKPTFMHQAPLRRLQTTSYHTKYKSQGFVKSSRDATLPTRAITVSFLWLQCTIASSTPTVNSLRPVAHVRIGLFICLLFVVYLLNIFNFHNVIYLGSFFLFSRCISSGARGGKRNSAIAITRKHAVSINSHYLRSHFTIFVAQHVSIHCLFRMGGSD